MTHHLMLVPSMACPAHCRYCFGPHEGGAAMSQQTLQAIIHWQNALPANGALEITFHGGEPLVPGAGFYREALPLLREGLRSRQVHFALQSNLWLLDDELCDLLCQYRVSVGTSLDGPEWITDAQRGAGYFQRTMVGIERARSRGVAVGCICTFTAQSAVHASQILDFFVREGLNFTVHAALPSLHYPQAASWALSPEAHGQLLVEMLDRYLDNLDRVRISTLDALCRSVSARRGSICTFGDCLGDYLAVGPEGAIYPCQRFVGMSEYLMGSVHDGPASPALQASPVWRMFEDRQQRIVEECGNCPHLDLCHGGCPYNALAANGGDFGRALRDPHCPSYRRIFGHIAERAIGEVFSPQNMEEVVQRVDPEKGLLRRGRLLSLMRKGPHPYETAQHARRILAAVALAATSSPEEAASRFQRLGLATCPERTTTGLRALHGRLVAPSLRLNNLYLHLTFSCPLRCAHCYAQAGPGHKEYLPLPDTIAACRQAAGLGFRHVILTGGEPLIHPERDALLDALAGLRREVKPLLTVLRTSLALAMDENLLWRIGHSTDQVVVSVDGDRETHDARRGTGNYDLTVRNLRALAEMGGDADISLAAVLPLGLAGGPPGDAVRALGKELGVRRIRFRPLLPLGRAVDTALDIVPETLWGHLDPQEMVAYGFSPTASCGMGQNLYVEPDGSAYPCYAWHGQQWSLGYIRAAGGLREVIASPAFRDLGQHTVNSHRGCRQCALRYLCGGACRAWSRQPAEAQGDLDAPPLDCSHLHGRASALLLSALGYLSISVEQWLGAGLPLPDAPPILVSQSS
jgi:uncharacterized protein